MFDGIKRMLGISSARIAAEAFRCEDNEIQINRSPHEARRIRKAHRKDRAAKHARRRNRR